MLNATQVKRRSSLKKGASRSGAYKDERLCELELQNTILATRVQALEKTCRELEDSRNGFAALYENAPLSYVTFDPTGHIQDSNGAVSKLLNIPPSKFRGIPFSLLVFRDDLRRYLDHLLRCNNKEAGRHVTELRLQDRNGKVFPAQLISVPFATGGRKMFLTAIVDLTERQEHEKALAEAKEFAESIVETIREPLVVLNSELRVVSVNRAFTEYFKKSGKWAKGQLLEMFLNLWWSGNTLRGELEKVLLTNQPIENFPIEVKLRDLGNRTLLVNARRLYRKTQPGGFILLALEDITDRQNAELQIRTINEELEKRVATRTEALQKSYQQMESFCYSIAHDLRAPLRSMKSFSDLLIEHGGAELSEEGRDFLQRIQQSAVRMDLLIRDLLHYGQLNTINLSLQEIDLDEFTRDLITQCDPDIRENHGSVKIQGPLPKILGHPVVLHVVLTNLISNALKFVRPSVPPQVILRAENQGAHFRLYVEDNGIGIEPENQKVIFGVFQRLHGTSHFPGTGIGLALVQKGIERIGGRVGVESIAGQGSRFWVELLKPETLKQQSPI